MLRDVGPHCELAIEAVEEDCPVDDCDEEGVGRDCCVEEVVEGLEGAGEAV